MEKFHYVTRAGGARGRDAWGGGHFGAGRGGRLHQGVDFVARAGDDILSPIDGNIVRMAAPYKNDFRFTGVVVEGTGPWAGVEVKVFYVQGYRSGPVNVGEKLGVAQDVAIKY